MQFVLTRIKSIIMQGRPLEVTTVEGQSLPYLNIDTQFIYVQILCFAFQKLTRRSICCHLKLIIDQTSSLLIYIPRTKNKSLPWPSIGVS